MTVQTLMSTMDSREITEWMAYDMTCSEEWQEKHKREAQLEASRQMSDEDKLKAFKAMLGGST